MLTRILTNILAVFDKYSDKTSSLPVEPKNFKAIPI